MDTSWYFTEDWPPKDFDYTPELRKLNFRLVDHKDFLKAEEFDLLAKQKVYELSLNQGLFIDSQGRMFDLRPKNCDGYKNFISKTKDNLLELHLDAIAKKNSNSGDLKSFKLKVKKKD